MQTKCSVLYSLKQKKNAFIIQAKPILKGLPINTDVNAFMIIYIIHTSIQLISKDTEI